MISRGVTCDADNQLTSVLQRKHPHELLDSVVKERLVKSVSSQPRRAFYSSVSSCQAVIFRSFQNFLINFNHLRFVRCFISRQREANSTALQPAVNHLFSPLSIRASRPKHFLAIPNLQLIEFQGVLGSDCAGSGANYREIQKPVKHLFEFIPNST